MMLLGLLDRDILAQASQKEDAGQAKLFRIFRAVSQLFDCLGLTDCLRVREPIFGNLPQCRVAAGRPV